MQPTSTDIRQWLLKQPDWLQEAANRLLSTGPLGPSDVQDLVALLKTPQGQKITNHRSFADLQQPAHANADLRLNSIDEIAGIEGLAPRRPTPI